MQTCHIPSILCSIFTLTHLLQNQNLRWILHNHTPLILLLISILDSFISHPLTLNYLRLSHVVPSTDAMCLFWNYANSIFTVSTYWTLAWGSLERHFLIFQSNWFSTRCGRILFHYIPLFITTFLYPVVANIVVILLYPCQNQFNMQSLFCAFPCALKISSVALYTRFAHQFIPVFIVAGSTLALFVRVINRRRQVQNNQVNWRRYRRMIIQLLTLASLFLTLTVPATTVSIIQNCCLPTFAITVQVSYLNFFVRFLTLFMPFVCLSLLPEIWHKLLTCKKTQARPIGRKHVRVTPAQYKR